MSLDSPSPKVYLVGRMENANREVSLLCPKLREEQRMDFDYYTSFGIWLLWNVHLEEKNMQMFRSIMSRVGSRDLGFTLDYSLKQHSQQTLS